MKQKRIAAVLTACLLAGALALPCAADLPQQGGAVMSSLEMAVEAAGGLPLDSAYIPNLALLEALQEYDEDGDGSLTAKERRYLSSLWLEEAGAEPLDGLEYLTELEALYCPGAHFTSLDVSMLEDLESVSIYGAALEELILPKGIESVYVNDCSLTALDVSGCGSLKNLDVSSNKLTELDLNGCGSLDSLEVSDNRLTALDVSNCPELNYLSCSDNKLTELNVSGCPELETLYCTNNKLTELDLSACTELERLGVYNNALTSLDVSGCIELEYLDCSGNRLTALNVANCGVLQDLYCSSNKLESLDVSECVELEWLSCYDNSIQTLDVSRCRELTRGNVLADDDCKVKYGGLFGLDLHSIWGAVRILLAVVAVAGAVVWLVRRRLSRTQGR